MYSPLVVYMHNENQRKSPLYVEHSENELVASSENENVIFISIFTIQFNIVSVRRLYVFLLLKLRAANVNFSKLL